MLHEVLRPIYLVGYLPIRDETVHSEESVLCQSLDIVLTAKLPQHSGDIMM